MEARFARVTPAFVLAIFLLPFSGTLSVAHAAGYKTTNFIVSAPTPELAKEIGDQAEACRRQLAIEWLGKEMPAWAKSCPINAKVAPSLGAGGATSFVFDRGEVFGWEMNIQGSRERILDSVIPHEVTHTIFASHFREPLPRWADEGACTTVEHRSEISKQERMLIEFLKTGRGIPFDRMFAMKEYPNDVMPLYSQGHSTAQWLIESRGRQEFLAFIADGLKDENWPRAVRAHYGFSDYPTMQSAWLDWVKQGRPQLTPETSPIAKLVAQTHGTGANVAVPAGLRGQSPDVITPVAVTMPNQAGSNQVAPAHATPNHVASNSPTTVAVASGSVYAEAARAQRERLERGNQRLAEATKTAAPSNTSSVYAVRDQGKIRR